MACHLLSTKPRADSRFAPNLWEMVLFCNDVSHWLGVSLQLALPALIWTNLDLLSTEPLPANLGEISKMNLEMLSTKWWWFHLDLNVLKLWNISSSILSTIFLASVHIHIHHCGQDQECKERKPHLLNSPLDIIKIFAEMWIKPIESHSYLTGATAAKLWWHLSDMNYTN